MTLIILYWFNSTMITVCNIRGQIKCIRKISWHSCSLSQLFWVCRAEDGRQGLLSYNPRLYTFLVNRATVLFPLAATVVESCSIAAWSLTSGIGFPLHSLSFHFPGHLVLVMETQFCSEAPGLGHPKCLLFTCCCWWKMLCCQMMLFGRWRKKPFSSSSDAQINLAPPTATKILQ